MAIPRVIHQTAQSKILFDDHSVLQKQILTLGILFFYDAYKENVQRADLFRVSVVYAWGSFSVDMDIVCHKSLDALCLFDMVFVEEKTLTEADRICSGNKDALRIANYMFGCSPRYSFLAEVLKRRVKALDRPIVTENDIIEATGPGLLSTAYHDCKDVYSIHVLENKSIFCEKCKIISCQFGEYATYLHDGVWRWQKKKKRGVLVGF